MDTVYKRIKNNKDLYMKYYVKIKFIYNQHDIQHYCNK